MISMRPGHFSDCFNVAASRPAQITTRCVDRPVKGARQELIQEPALQEAPPSTQNFAQ